MLASSNVSTVSYREVWCRGERDTAQMSIKAKGGRNRTFRHLPPETSHCWDLLRPFACVRDQDLPEYPLTP